MILGQHVYMEPDQGQEDKKEGIWLDDYYFVIEEDGTAYTWAASSANVLEKRKVTLGEYDEDLAAYEVVDGLTEEDYITVPGDELAEGLPVIYNDDSYGNDMDGSMPMGDDMFMDGDMDMSMDGDASMGDDMFMDGDMDMSTGGDFYDDGMMDGEVYDEGMMNGGVYDEGMMDGEAYDEFTQNGEVYDADMAHDSGMEEMDGLGGEEYVDKEVSNE